MSGSSDHLLGPDDLGPTGVDELLARASALADGAPPLDLGRRVVANLFLSSSLRTRLGFAVAAQRLGWTVIDLDESRWDPNMSAAESFGDTLRTTSGLVDAVVVRAPVRLADPDLVRRARCPIVNAGDLDHHPTQALIDLFAIERLAGPVGGLRIALVGDATMRASRSLLQTLAGRPPQRLLIVTPVGRAEHGVDLGDVLPTRTVAGSMADLDQADVVVVSGLAPGAGPRFLDEAERRRFAIGEDTMRRLGPDALVLSPLPVIDEIDDAVRDDPRVRMFEASDLSVHVRVAALEHVAGRLPA